MPKEKAIMNNELTQQQYENIVRLQQLFKDIAVALAIAFEGVDDREESQPYGPVNTWRWSIFKAYRKQVSILGFRLPITITKEQILVELSAGQYGLQPSCQVRDPQALEVVRPIIAQFNGGIPSYSAFMALNDPKDARPNLTKSWSVLVEF